MEQSPEYTLEDLLENIKQIFPESDEAFIYQWHHPELNLYYIGSHKGSIDDGYTGSGIDFNRQLESNPIEEWERTILTYCSKKDRYNVEQLFLIFYNAANNPKFLNRTDIAGGFGIGEDNCNFKNGLYVGCPEDAQARRVWFESLSPERQEEIRTYERELKKEWHQENKEEILSQKKEWYEKLTPEQKRGRTDTQTIRRRTIRRIIEMDNTYTKDYFKGMKHGEVLKIEEEVKKNIENNKNTLEKFWE